MLGAGLAFLLCAAFVFWYMHTAQAAKVFCAAVSAGDYAAAILQEAKKSEFDVRERRGTSSGEHVYVLSKPPNGASTCAIHVTGGEVKKVKYVLTL